ncbi:hypothetical protein VDG1235_3128 [Verrucomicrobiia bacterium DG1235]|nr:hypothetical protein VDG1235_3128 [Verrucomicrobiae bacterium DG1235]
MKIGPLDGGHGFHSRFTSHRIFENPDTWGIVSKPTSDLTKRKKEHPSLLL